MFDKIKTKNWNFFYDLRQSTSIHAASVNTPTYFSTLISRDNLHTTTDLFILTCILQLLSTAANFIVSY